MTLPIFLDANIVIYAAGRPHAYKDHCREILQLAARWPRAFCTDVEVLQELLHRYVRLQAWAQGRLVVTEFAALMRDRVESVTISDIEAASALADRFPGSGGRDLLHAAVMTRIGANSIASADRDFDRFPDLIRLDPLDLSAWKALITFQ